jgi:hypothetical protein
MNMRVRSHVLGQVTAEPSYLSLERIASEVIHPDDIDVTFSGMHSVTVPGALPS